MVTTVHNVAGWQMFSLPTLIVDYVQAGSLLGLGSHIRTVSISNMNKNKPLSGAQKRKKVRELEAQKAKLPKLRQYFHKSDNSNSSLHAETSSDTVLLHVSSKYCHFIFLLFFIKKIILFRHFNK